MIVNNQKHDDYFVHQIEVKDYRHLNRLDLFVPLVKSKSVLHVGNIDWPITDPQNSLHLRLAEVANNIDGIDPNIEGSEDIKIKNGKQYHKWNEVKGKTYDLILVPEVIEHVDSYRKFFNNLDTVNGPIMVTAPCAWACNSFFEKRENIFLEVVHPDHNCWFSPFTLKNTIEKYGKRRVSAMYWVNRMSIAAIAI